MRPSTILTLALGVGLFAAHPAAADEPRDLDAALRKQADKILDYARAHNAKNIAVLKFMVRTGDGPFSDNVGPLNLGLAERLTVALVLALPNDDIGVIANANEALKGSGASHLDEEGRRRCFASRRFVLAWDVQETPVRPDLFITGTATLSRDLQTTTIALQAFGRDCRMDSLGEFTVRTTTRTLIDTGHSFLFTRRTHPRMFAGARGGDDEDLDKPAIDLSQKYSAESKHDDLPSFEREAPIRVTVYYNDQPIPIKDGAIPEPKLGDKVWFKIENISDETFGVVLKVNGENTIYREKFDDRDCMKWIINPGGTVIVRGYQKGLNEREDFKVLTTEASRANEIRYGELTGTFQVTAFRARSDKDPPPPPPPPVVKEEQQVASAISRGSVKIEGTQPNSLKSLQRELKQHVKNTANARGMIDSDTENTKPHLVKKVPFEADPKIPVMSYRIRYYQSGNGK